MDHEVLASDLQLLALDRTFLTREEREEQTVSARIHLRVPLSEFLLEANRLAGAVIRHAERLSAASGGRIGAHTAKEMQKLANDILRIERERERMVVGPSRPLVRRAEMLVSEIAAAARFIAIEKPIIAEQLQRIRSGPRRRSAAAAAWALEMHLALVREHAREFAAILPPHFMEIAAHVLTTIEEHRTSRCSATAAVMAQTRARDDLVARLHALVSAVRRLDALLARSEPITESSRGARRTPSS